VGAGRNAAAAAAIAAGAELLVFLDVDCLPGPEVFARYADAAAAHPDALLAGPVTYLASVQRPAVADLPHLTRPHRARPALPAGEMRVAEPDEYDLFWSLSFALTADRWRDGPRFSERYEGYGGEDTDFAASLRAAGVPLAWVGGAHAYHQHHPTSSPPWQHLDDILRNGATFADRWGRWPMEGWLRAFAEQGAVRWDGHAWRRTQA
jgi:GT2 family glycosyltransferase